MQVSHYLVCKKLFPEDHVYFVGLIYCLGESRKENYIFHHLTEDKKMEMKDKKHIGPEKNKILLN